MTPIATATNTPGPPITVGMGPRAIAITPDGKTVYVASWQAGVVTPIATATNTPGRPIEVGEGARAFAITADGKTLYVLVWGEPGSVVPIATATNTPGTPIEVGDLRRDRARALSRPLPRTRLLPNLVTDGFCHARLCVYMNHALLPRPVALRPQTGLTGSGSHIPSYGGSGGGHPHFHRHSGSRQSSLTKPALSAWESVPSGLLYGLSCKAGCL